MAFSTSFAKVQGLTARSPVVRRAPVRVRAEVEAEKSATDVATDLPEFSFKSNTRSSIGYLEEDSAGQTNIFAVQPKQYVQGSSYDDTTGTDSNAIFGVGGAVLGLAVVGLGVTALTSLGGGNIMCQAGSDSSSSSSVAFACVSGDPFPIMSLVAGLVLAGAQF